MSPKPVGETSSDPAMTETELQNLIVKAARLSGWMVYHTYDSRRSEPGFPDLVLLHRKRGQLIFAELKSASGRISPAQQDWLAALNHVALHDDFTLSVRVWRPEDIDLALLELMQRSR